MKYNKDKKVKVNNFLAFILYKFNHGLWLKFYADIALIQTSKLQVNFTEFS